MRVLNPSEVIVLMHAFAIGEPIEGFKGSIDSLLVKGAILADKSRCGYSTTPMGACWVEMICETPAPVQRWVDPREKKQ